MRTVSSKGAPSRSLPWWGDITVRLLGLTAVVAFIAGSFVARHQPPSAAQDTRASSATSARAQPAHSPPVRRPESVRFFFTPSTGDGTAAPPGPYTPNATRDLVRVALGDGRPTYSPSFGRTADTLLFHAEDANGTRLIQARTDGRGQLVATTVLAADHAHSYHVRTSPDGRTLAYDSDRDGERGIYVQAIGAARADRVSGPGYAAVPAWSPDGKRLAFVRAEKARPRVWNLFVIDLATSDQRRLTHYAVGQVWPGNWFKDGRRLVYTHETDLWVLDTTAGTARRFKTPIAGRLLRTATASSDGQRIAFQVYGDGLWVLNLRSGRMARWLADRSAEEFAWSPDDSRLAFHSRRDGRWSVWTMAVPDALKRQP